MVKFLQGQKTSLAFEVEYLKKEKEKLEGAIATDKYLLEQTLAQALINLKLQRPDLFILSGPEQIAMLLKVILK
jgi:acid phosphatase class B